MNKFYWIIFGFFFSFSSGICQQKFFEKITIEPQIGVSIPIGFFSRAKVEPSLNQNVNSGDQYREFRGFVKKEGGQAQVGTITRMEVSYCFSPSFIFSMNYSRVNNRIDVSPQERYFETNLQNRTDFFGNEFQIFGILESEDYRANLWYFGMGYRQTFQGWSIFTNGYFGVNRLQFPNYVWSFDSPGPTTILRPKETTDKQVPETIPSILYGIGFGIEKSMADRFGISLEFKHLRSNHPHDYWNLTLVGSGVYEIEDIIPFRIITAEIGLAYKLFK